MGNMAVGLAVVGAGGMNTSYANGIPLFDCQMVDVGSRLAPNVQQVCGNGRTGINLEQVKILPTVAFKMGEHSIGATLQIGYQQFKGEGISNFANPMFSSDATHMNHQGRDDSWGYGVSVGYLGQFGMFSLGLVYNSKIDMDEMDNYAGLFEGGGDLDVPASYGIGFTLKPDSALTASLDISRIESSDVDAMGNPVGNHYAFGGTTLFGANGGPGFGWDDVTLYKLGLAYQVSDMTTLRIGYAYGDQPIGKDQTLLNSLAPATIKQHASVGATWMLDNKSEVTMYYVHSFSNKVKGNAGNIPANFGGGTVDVEMVQDAIGIGYGWNF
jgi:long-chain fatty acid transport protein